MSCRRRVDSRVGVPNPATWRFLHIELAYTVTNMTKGGLKMAGKFELYKDKAAEYRFRLRAGNGQGLLFSEGYKAKGSAEKGVESVRKNAPIDERYERKATKAGKHMFNLKATNGQVIATREQCESDASREAGIESVKNNAPNAALDDQTG